MKESPDNGDQTSALTMSGFTKQREVVQIPPPPSV